MKNVGIGKLLFCLLLFSIIILKSQIAYANWSNLSVDELAEQSDYIFIGKIGDKYEEENDSQEDIPGVKWDIQVYFTLKGELDFDFYEYGYDHVIVITPPKNQSTYYSLGLWSNKVLIFANKVGKYYSPISPQGVIQLGLKENFPYYGVEEVISGSELMRSINIIDKDVDESYKEKIEEFIKSSNAYSTCINSPFTCGTPDVNSIRYKMTITLSMLVLLVLMILIAVIKYIKSHRKKQRLKKIYII